MTVSQFYASTMAHTIGNLKDQNDQACLRQQLLEGWWEMDKCPYYRVYPTIIPMLLKLNLSIDAGLIKLPPNLRSFAVNFPKTDHKLSFDANGARYSIRSLICGPASLVSQQQNYDGISIWIDFGETMGMCGLTNHPTVSTFPILTYINMPIKEGITVEEASHMLHADPTATYGIMMPQEIKAGIIKLVCTLCLLENDPAIIEPDILDKDRANYERNPSQVMVDRAVRRGKIGWNVGRKIEMIPHVRGPSPLALYWTGKGRTIPLIRYRKGCIVHRELITKVSNIEGYGEQQESQIKQGHRAQNQNRSESEVADHVGEAGISGSMQKEETDTG